ncbi:hypothetical protein [Kitasatospora indigofera]|uniref:hypothetical protein n=1 Tax=Kitasatospora indigofera TaxID=67307 RepID=UPI0036A3FF39
MPSTTNLSVQPLPVGWTPPADWGRRQPFHDAPDRERGYEGGVAYVLDLQKREVAAVPAKDSTDPELGEYLVFDHIWKAVVPNRMRLGVLALGFHPEFATAEDANGILQEVAPLAQRLVDTLLPVAGTSTYDWSPTAVLATHEIEHVIDRTPYRGTEHDFPFRQNRYLLQADALFKAHPDLIEPRWAEAGADEVDGVLAEIHGACRRLAAVPANFDALVALTTIGPLPEDVNGRTVEEFRLVGVRAWLYDLREERAGGMTPVDAALWDGITAYALLVRDDATPADLDRIAEQVRAAAAEQGVKLLAARSWAWSLCKRRREEVRAELGRIGEQISHWEGELKPAKVQRRALVTRVLAWGEQGDTDSALAGLASMSHTAVGTIRKALVTDDDLAE